MNWTPIIIIRALPPFIRFHFFQPGLSLSLSSLESWRSRFPPHKAFVLSLALPSRSPQLVSPPPQRAPPSSLFAPPSAPCTTIFERGPRDRTTRSRRRERASERARERERPRPRTKPLLLLGAKVSPPGGGGRRRRRAFLAQFYAILLLPPFAFYPCQLVPPPPRTKIGILYIRHLWGNTEVGCGERRSMLRLIGWDEPKLTNGQQSTRKKYKNENCAQNILHKTKPEF